MRRERTTRERLLEATISIIENEGEDGVRIDHVAELAGFTKPVVYHHFAGREDLIVAALSERYARAMSLAYDDLKIAAARCRSGEQFKAVLLQSMENYVGEEGAYRRQLRIEALGAAVSRPDLRASLVEVQRRRVDQFTEILEIAREEGWLRIDAEPRDLSMWLAGLVLSRHFVENDSDHFDPMLCDSISLWVVDKFFGDV